MNGSVKAFHALAFKKKKSSGRKFDRSGVYEFFFICGIGVSELYCYWKWSTQIWWWHDASPFEFVLFFSLHFVNFIKSSEHENRNEKQT